jgi:hypothetical protein
MRYQRLRTNRESSGHFSIEQQEKEKEGIGCLYMIV